MHCERVRELMSPYLDDALPGQDRTLLAAHLASCAGCAKLAADWRGVLRTLSALGRQPPPPSLLPRLRRALADAQVAKPGRQLRPTSLPRRAHSAASAFGWAAPVLAASALTALATWWLLSLSQPEGRLEHDVLTAHMRSLLQEHPTHVASADTHWIKPWFSGRVDFSPSVSDLSAEGFLLMGARLDYIGERRVGVLVYQRRQHWIDVFVWPDPGADQRAGRVAVRKGYTLVGWTRHGLAYWAISDLGAGELEPLQRLL